MGPGDDGKAAADFISSSNPLSNAPKPGEGPSRESRENGNYDILFCGDINDESVHVSVVGDMDPGYGSTSKMIAESAICLVKECEDLNLHPGPYQKRVQGSVERLPLER